MLLYVWRRALTYIDAELRASQTRGQQALWGVTQGLGRTLLPFVAILSVIAGLRQVLPSLPVYESLLDALSMAAFVLIVAQWLGSSLFEPEANAVAVFTDGESSSGAGRPALRWACLPG